MVKFAILDYFKIRICFLESISRARELSRKQVEMNKNVVLWDRIIHSHQIIKHSYKLSTEIYLDMCTLPLTNEVPSLGSGENCVCCWRSLDRSEVAAQKSQKRPSGCWVQVSLALSRILLSLKIQRVQLQVATSPEGQE